MTRYTFEHDERLVQAAFAQDRAALDALVSYLMPAVRRGVVRALAANGRRRGHAFASQDVLDPLHDVFLTLLDDGGRILRTWDPARGLSLRGFVRLVARREASAILQSGRRSAWAEQPTSNDVLARHPASGTPEHHVAAQEQLDLIRAHVTRSLSPRGRDLFDALFTEHQSVAEVCARFAMTANAVYTFRNRLRRLIGDLGTTPADRRPA